MQPASLRKPMFGKEVEIAVWGVDPRLAEGVLEDAYERGRMLEKIFNLYDESSILSKLNRKRELEAPKEMITVLSKALELCDKTKGRYDVSLGKRFLARKSGKPLPKVGCSYKNIEIKGRMVVLTHEDAILDLGSIAKGYIADEMARALMAEGVLDGLIDARGDIRTFGEERVLGIQHPREKGIIGSIKVKDAGVATSGDYNQSSFDEPHILNNRDFISVTTIAESLIGADGYATAIFVTPSEEIDMLLSGSGIKAMCVRKDLAIEYHNGFERCIA